MSLSNFFQQKVRPHARQFLRYLFSGGLAFAIDFGSFELMIHVLDIWYVLASIISGTLGFFSAFVLHKYIVFRKHEETLSHFLRYCLMQSCNVIAQTIIIYVAVEYMGAPREIAKIFAIACSVSWNFFLYKFLVYV